MWEGAGLSVKGEVNSNLGGTQTTPRKQDDHGLESMYTCHLRSCAPRNQIRALDGVGIMEWQRRLGVGRRLGPMGFLGSSQTDVRCFEMSYGFVCSTQVGTRAGIGVEKAGRTGK